ncbi:MAG: VOC family protein [Acidobacteriota bacterium]|nr:VOC family protein [Acidobacteriota bacterium]
MARQSLSEQLDRAIAARMAQPGAPLPEEPRIAPLAKLADQLRNLPSEYFRDRLREELEWEAKMSKAAGTKPVREGFHTITPYIAVREAHELVDFVKSAFGAEGQVFGTGSQGGIHAEVKIGDSMLMIGGGEAWKGTPMPTALHYYVPDADAVYRRALEAGATSLLEPVDQFYGDREAAVRDLAGNHWYIATHLSGSYIPPGLRSIQVSLHPRGAASLVEFLVRALGAEEISRHTSPDGTIAHTTLRLGSSTFEMGEAHGPWQPMPTMFNLYVPDADALYRRAMEAGAESFAEPADQPHGARTAAIKDPAGNLWYMSTPKKQPAE